jgi:PmbA protein
MAKVVPEDIYAGLAEDAAIPPPRLELDLVDPFEPPPELLLARAQEAEDAARAVAGVTNSEGADASWSQGHHLLVTSAGFAGHSQSTHHSTSVTALAGTGTAMQRDYDYSTTVYFADQDQPAVLGRKAGERAVARLNPRRPQTARMPVIFDSRVSTSLIGHLLGAISGAAIARGTSFLKDALNTRIFAPGVALLEDPHRKRGLRSTWLLDSRSARQLKLRSTGHARGTGNITLAAGPHSLAALIADLAEGLYVTELIGMGVNQLTGDYSRGAAGFMIRNGQLAEPVAELTIAGTLPAMFASLASADDLIIKHGTNAPSVRIEGMTVAGG